MTKRLLSSAPMIAAAALGISACGGSSSGPNVKIALAPSQGATEATVSPTTGASGTSGASSTTTTTPTTTPSTTTPATAVPTPTSGPLSTEPKITLPKGPAPTTLKTIDLIKGTGATAAANKGIDVNYVGALYKNGKIFDASWNRKQTFHFTLGVGQVIPGWDKGLVGMKVGGRRELIIPAAEAYGASGSPPTIPPNSPLIFIVDLLKVS